VADTIGSEGFFWIVLPWVVVPHWLSGYSRSGTSVPAVAGAVNKRLVAVSN
jgi:hypothetical protein